MLKISCILTWEMEKLWDIREYGLIGLWVKRESTVF